MEGLQWDKDFALEQTADDNDLLQELIDIFKESALSDLEKIRESVKLDDAVMGSAACHSLKGAAASLGFNKIRGVTEDMEKYYRDGSLLVVARKLPELEKLLALLQDL